MSNDVVRMLKEREREMGKETGSGKMATVVRKHLSLNLNAP